MKDIHRMNHPKSLDPLLDDFIPECGGFRNAGGNISSIITLTGVGDTSWGEYKNEIVKVLENYPREYENLHILNSTALKEMSKPPQVDWEAYKAAEE